MRHRREVWSVGLDQQTVGWTGGQTAGMTQFLKVIIPLNEKYALIANPASHTASPDEKL